MMTVINVVAPVFAIVALGYLAVRFRLYPESGVPGLIAFINGFATPLLLFRAALTLDFEHFRIDHIGPYYLAAIIVFFLAIPVARHLFKNRPGESVAAAFTATFSNTVLLGLPIISRAFGDPALPTTFAIIGLHAAVLMTIAMIVMETTRSDGLPFFAALQKTLQSLVKNPLIVAILLGLVGNLMGLELPTVANDFVGIMVQAIVPVALFGLGGALNAYQVKDNWTEALAMSGFKLILHPALTWLILVPILKVDHEFARYVVIMAAMPAGVNVYIFATFYKRGMDLAANSILFTTALSVITISAWLAILS